MYLSIRLSLWFLAFIEKRPKCHVVQQFIDGAIALQSDVATFSEPMKEASSINIKMPELGVNNSNKMTGTGTTWI